MRDGKRAFFDIITRRAAKGVGAGLAAAGLATALSMSPSPAAAQDFVPFGEGGIFVGYTWGPGRGFTWGIEGRGGADFTDQWCPGVVSFSAAGVARLSFVELRPQLHFGGQAGMVSGIVSVMGDIGVGYRWGEDGGFSVPIGMEMQVYMGSTFVRADPALQNVTVGGGLFVPARDNDFGCAIPGRPLHDEDGRTPLPIAERLDETRRPHDLDPDVADALAAEWEERARAEWASVPAFLQLADQLRVARAPDELVRAALRAADDEARHAVATARAAMCFGGAPIRLGAVTPVTRALARGREALVRLAAESWVDGCVGEGVAASAAAREAELAGVDALRGMQRMIADDEARHAELAWSVLGWAVGEGGDDVRHAVDAVREAVPSEGARVSDDALELARFGVLDTVDHEGVAAAHRERAEARLDALLG